MSKLLHTAQLLATAALAIYTLSTAAELSSLKREHSRLEDRVIQEHTETGKPVKYKHRGFCRSTCRYTPRA